MSRYKLYKSHYKAHYKSRSESQFTSPVSCKRIRRHQISKKAEHTTCSGPSKIKTGDNSRSCKRTALQLTPAPAIETTLKVGVWNVRGLGSPEKKSNLTDLLKEETPDVFVLVDHGQRTGDKLRKMLISEYKIVALNESDTDTPTAVCIVAKHNLNCQPVPIQELCKAVRPKGLEMLSVIVEGIVIVGMYRRPDNRQGGEKCTVLEFYDYLWSMLSEVATKKIHIISLGDFNTAKKKEVKDFNERSSQRAFPCRMLFDENTATHEKGGTLDNIIVEVNDVEVLLLKRSDSLLGSDHYPLFAHLKFRFKNKESFSGKNYKGARLKVWKRYQETAFTPLGGPSCSGRVKKVS